MNMIRKIDLPSYGSISDLKKQILDNSDEKEQ